MNNPALIFAFIEVESSFNPRAYRSDVNGGSYGLTQIDLPTAKDRGYAGTAIGLGDPCTNIKWFCAIIDWMAADLTRHGLYTLDNLAASYNSGLQHVIGGGADMAYATKISAAYARWCAALGMASDFPTSMPKV